MEKDSLTYSFLALREKLHRSALRFLRNDEDARDALQDTFVNLWKDPSPRSDAETRNRLFVILRNLCIDRLRRGRSEPMTESAAQAMVVDPPEGEDMERFESLLSEGLTETQLRIYRYVVHEGTEYEEIAFLMGISVEAVRMNMSRARKRIRENYKRLNS